MLKFKDLLPVDSRSEFVAIIWDGKVVARTTLQTTLDLVLAAESTMN